MKRSFMVKQTARLTKFISLSIISIFLAMTSFIALPVPAFASATGCAAGHPSLGPTTYCVTLNGSKLRVNYVKGIFRGSAFACSYSITAEFFTTNWTWYKTYTSSKTSGCATGGSKQININKNMRSGYMCSTLKYKNTPSGSWRYMSVCHRIHS